MGSSTSALEVGKRFHSLANSDSVSEDEFLTLLSALPSLSEAHLNSSIPYSTLKELRHSHTKGFAHLLYLCIKEIVGIAELRSHEVLKCDEQRESRFQGALIFLQRMMPYALESGCVKPGNNSALASISRAQEAQRLSNDSISEVNEESESPPQARGDNKRTNSTVNFVQLFFCEGSKCDDDHPEKRFKPLSKNNPAPIGETLMRSLVECCFIPGLTLSATVFPKDPEPSITLPNVDTRLLWQYGVSSPDPLTKRRLAATAKECLYRKLVLKTIQICLSSQLYHTSDFRDTIFMESLINGKKVPLMATLAVSMLNTVLNYEPYGALPYSSYLSNRDEDVVIASCRLLCTVLCYKGIPLASPADPTIDEDNKSSEQNFTRSNTPDSSVPDGNSDPPRSGSRRAGSLPKKRVHRNTTRPRATDSRNAESSYIHSVRSTFVNITLTEAKTILFNYVNIIRLRSYASQTYLPESQHSLASENEFMLLLWKLVDTSPQVQSQLANREDTLLDYLVPLLCYAMDVRKSTQYVYHLQLVVFLLHRLSEKKRFGTICNSPIKESIPFSFPKLSSQSTYVDLIVIAFCLIMKSNDPVFVPYYILCSSIITNIAPFATFLDKDSSAILVYVFAKVTQINLTRPRSDKIYETTMLSLCEAIASILQYHERGSKYLLASLINYRGVIHRAKVAYIDQGTKELAFAGAAPFLVETLEIAVNVCMPIVSSEGALASVQEEKPNDNDSTIHVVTHGVEQNDAVVKKLESVTLVGKTPTPHPIGLRRLLGSKEMDNWATLFLWTTLLDQMGNNCFGDRQSMKLFSSPKR